MTETRMAQAEGGVQNPSALGVEKQETRPPNSEDVPPSPGAGSLLFTDGTLADVVASEFGDLSVPSEDSAGPQDRGFPEIESIGEEPSIRDVPEDSAEIKAHPALSSSSATPAVPQDPGFPEIDSIVEEPTIRDIPEDSAEIKADPALSLSSATTPPPIIVNGAERQPLGPSTSGADELYNASAFGDGETHSRQRILAFAAKRCANAVQRNPRDYDALYNWALVLQESADNINSDLVGVGKDQLLEEACSKYQAATDICPTLHEAFYNWAIAISDRAKARGRTKEAEDLWKQACKRYERAVQLNRSSPQALNNWGLALQELSGIVSMKDKRSIVKAAIKKFRAAIALQFDFHRAIYNLGTVLYSLAEDTMRSVGHQGGNKELTAADLYSQSAIYVAAAHALKPEYPVYKSALRLVRSKLPLAFLKTGYLVVPPENDTLAPHNDWKRLWFVLDHEALYQVDKTAQGSLEPSPTKKVITSKSFGLKADNSYRFRVEISDICGLNSCADLSLPPGASLEIDTIHGQKYLIANSWEEVECWVDAIRLVYTIYSRGQSDILGGIIAG